MLNVSRETYNAETHVKRLYKSLMKKAKSKETKTMLYFCTSFKKWFDESKFKLIEAGAELDLSHTFISQVLRRKASLSIGTAEKIADGLGTSVIEMLVEGRKLCGEEPLISKQEIDPHSQAKEAFSFILLQGGELAEEFAERAIAIAKKKKSEVATKPPSTSPLSKSA